MCSPERTQLLWHKNKFGVNRNGIFYNNITNEIWHQYFEKLPSEQVGNNAEFISSKFENIKMISLRISTECLSQIGPGIPEMKPNKTDHFEIVEVNIRAATGSLRFSSYVLLQ